MNKKIKSVILLLTLIVVLTTSIVFKQNGLKTIPLLVSLFVMLLASEANRYTFIIGGINSIIYAAVYLSMGLYASALYAFLFSFPVQIIIFIKWNKNPNGKSTIFKKMSKKTKLIYFSVFAVCWVAVFVGLKASGSDYAILDNSASLLGVLVTVLSFMAYIEYTTINLFSGLISIALNISVSLNDITYIPYVVFSLYSYYCAVCGYFNVRKIYRAQIKEGEKNE